MRDMSREPKFTLPQMPMSHINERTHGPLRTRLSGYDVVRFDDNWKARQTRIISPALTFKTERQALRTLRGMLTVLGKGSFSHATEYDGPELGLSDHKKEMVPLGRVIEALHGADETDIPFGGLKMVLVYDHDPQVRAKLRVKEGDETKVKLKVKGTILKAAWNQIRADIKRKFHVIV